VIGLPQPSCGGGRVGRVGPKIVVPALADPVPG